MLMPSTEFVVFPPDDEVLDNDDEDVDDALEEFMLDC